MGAGLLTAPSEETAGSGGGSPQRIITVLSPKGGSGKTTVGTNLAVGLAARYPRDVVLVDLDLQFGDVANVLRQSPSATIADVARKWPVDSATVKLSLTAHRTGAYTLCAPLSPAEADDIGSEHVVGVIRTLADSFRFVIVDTDPGLSERVLSALDISTDIVMVCATEFPSIRGLAKALEALDIVGLTEARRHFLLNRADAKVGVEADDIERAIGHTVDVRVPSSIDMVKATNTGIPIMEARSNDVLVKAFESLCDLFDPAKPAGGAADLAESGRGGRLFKRKA